MKKIIFLFFILFSLSIWSQGGGTHVLGHGGGVGCDFNVSPIPAKTNITITNGNPDGQGRGSEECNCKIIGYSIYNLGSELILSSESEPVNSLDINISQLEAGNYIILIELDQPIDEGIIISRQFIKE